MQARRRFCCQRHLLPSLLLPLGGPQPDARAPQAHLFDHVDILPHNTHVPDGCVPPCDIARQASRPDASSLRRGRSPPKHCTPCTAGRWAASRSPGRLQGGARLQSVRCVCLCGGGGRLGGPVVRSLCARPARCGGRRARQALRGV